MSESPLQYWVRTASKGKSTDECWVVQPTPSNGRRTISHNGKKTFVYRHVYEITYGPIPNGYQVCHTCDNGNCCNPRHLFVGTSTDNMRDASKKGRLNVSKKPWNRSKGMKLTKKDVNYILNSTESQKMLCEKFGVTRKTIYLIRSHKSWRNVCRE